MLDLKDAAKLARERISVRLAAAEKQKKGLPRSAAIIQQGASFRAHLADALKRTGDEQRSPSPAPEALFLAFPEKLFGKWHHLAFGPQRDAREAAPKPSSNADVWHSWDSLSSSTRITNFAGTQPRFVLLAHGLSPIDDSVLLLADIGRAFRAARALNVPLRVLLADISWISYNRSLRRFDLDDATIETGLRSCQDRRPRLYEGVGAEVKLHEILPYERKGAISAHKIQMIAKHYLDLTAKLWGEDKVNTSDPLGNADVATIGRPLQSSIGSDSPLRFLAGFPGTLPALEKALAPHLNIVRTLGQRFRILSVDTFSYYFAQYYAQNEYRGTHVKVAPVSERNFDEPYDELDDSFRSWGDGHEPTVSPEKSGQTRRRRLAAVYLPQYIMGDWELLPYSPLSLGAIPRSSGSSGSVANVRERVILTSDCASEQQPKIETILRLTLARAGVTQLNRLVADVLSFLQATVCARGQGTVDAACRRINGELEQMFTGLHPQLTKCFFIECEESASISDLWLSWLDAIERDSNLDYTPCHLLVASMTAEDWTDERFRAASVLLRTANRIACDLSL